MAPPHMMKGRDELEVLFVMNPPLSAIINGAKTGGACASEQSVKNDDGEDLKGVENVAGDLKSNTNVAAHETADIDLKVSKVMNNNNENTKPITTFLENETNISVDRKRVAVTKTQDFWSSPQEHLPALKQKAAEAEQGERPRPTIGKDRESVLDLDRKVEAMKLDILNTLEIASSLTSRQSPHSTTLTPGLEAIPINSCSSVSPSVTASQSQNSIVLAQGVQMVDIPKKSKACPFPPTQCTPEQKHAVVTVNLQRMKSFSPKISPRLSSQAEEMLTRFFSLSLRQKCGKNLIIKSIFEIERATEALTASDNEEGFSDLDKENMLKLVKANRELVRGCKMMGWDDGFFVEGVREINQILGEWDVAYPGGEWMDVICRMGNWDEDLVGEWKGMMEKLGEIEKRGEKEAQAAEGTDHKNGAMELAEGSENAWIDKEDEGNESMEYITPAEIATESEKKQAVLALLGHGVLDTPGMVNASGLATAIQSKSTDFSFIPPSNATIKPPRSASPVQATSCPSQSMPDPPISKNFDFNPEINAAPSSQPSVPAESMPPTFHFAGTTTSASPQFSKCVPTNNNDKIDFNLQSIFEPGPPGCSARLPSLPAFNCSPPNFAPLLDQISSPSSSPNLCYSSIFKSEIREKKTTSTLTTLTKTAHSLQTSVESIRAAIYGIDPSTQSPQSAKDAGLLLMNNCIGEWVTDLRNKTSTLDTKINEIGTLLESLRESSDAKLMGGTHQTAALAQIAALSAESKEVKNSEILSEIKIQMKRLLAKTEENMQGAKEMEGSIKNVVWKLCEENQELRQKLEKLEKQKRSVAGDDINLLRAEHAGLRREVAGLNRKMDLFIEGERNVVEREEESEGLMQLLWPQGEVKLNVGGKERGILADEPGYRRCEGDAEKLVLVGNQAGRGGGGGGGWCVVM